MNIKLTMCAKPSRYVNHSTITTTTTIISRNDGSRRYIPLDIPKMITTFLLEGGIKFSTYFENAHTHAVSPR